METILDHLRQHCKDGNIKWTLHALKRIRERGISSDIATQTILHGEVIEDYGDTKPFPCCLVLTMLDNKPVHVVASSDGTHTHIITVYYPSLEEWEDDFKTRKEQR